MCKIFVRLKILGIPDEKIVRGVYNLVRFCRKNVRNLNNLHERCAKYLFRLKILDIPDEKLFRGVYNLVRFRRKNVRNSNNFA